MSTQSKCVFSGTTVRRERQNTADWKGDKEYGGYNSFSVDFNY